MSHTIPDLLFKGFKYWILGWRPLSLQWGWSVFTKVIEGCYIADVDKVVGTIA